MNAADMPVALQVEIAREHAADLSALVARWKREGRGATSYIGTFTALDAGACAAGADTILALCDAVESAEADAADARQRARWNVDCQSDGSVLICFNLHDKGESCEYERWTPADELTTLRADLAAAREALKVADEVATRAHRALGHADVVGEVWEVSEEDARALQVAMTRFQVSRRAALGATP